MIKYYLLLKHNRIIHVKKIYNIHQSHHYHAFAIKLPLFTWVHFMTFVIQMIWDPIRII